MTNHELARQAAIQCNMYDTENFDCIDEMERDIAKVYAPAMAELERLRSGGWIKCSERTPKLHEDVCFMEKRRRHVGWLTHDDVWYSVFSGGHYELDRVTHWQPLPEPPEEET